jgi:DNA-binding NtrC family response regulator
VSHPAAYDMRPGRTPAEPRNFGIECVFLTCYNSDFEVLAVFLRQFGIHMHCAETLEKADFLMTVTDATVLVSDPTFGDGSWQEAAGMIESFHPGAALVVVADEKDSEFRTRALDRGVYILLSKPVRVSSLRQAVQAAHHISLNRSTARLERGPKIGK